MTTDELLHAILRKLDEKPLPVEIDMWDTAHIAAYLKMPYSTVRDFVLKKPDFPRPRRPGSGRARPVYLAREVIAWAESQT